MFIFRCPVPTNKTSCRTIKDIIYLFEKITRRNKEKKSIISEQSLDSKEKLKSLASQLGESCIATGLAALIGQKRDMELEKIKWKYERK